MFKKIFISLMLILFLSVSSAFGCRIVQNTPIAVFIREGTVRLIPARADHEIKIKDTIEDQHAKMLEDTFDGNWHGAKVAQFMWESGPVFIIVRKEHLVDCE